MTCVLGIEYEEERYDVLYESAVQLAFSLILQNATDVLLLVARSGEQLLEFPTASGSSARQSLAAMFTANGEALREMCTSHDVASVIERIFGIRKGFEREKAFQQYFKAFAALETTF